MIGPRILWECQIRRGCRTVGQPASRSVGFSAQLQPTTVGWIAVEASAAQAGMRKLLSIITIVSTCGPAASQAADAGKTLNSKYNVKHLTKQNKPEHYKVLLLTVLQLRKDWSFTSMDSLSNTKMNLLYTRKLFNGHFPPKTWQWF